MSIAMYDYNDMQDEEYTPPPRPPGEVIIEAMSARYLEQCHAKTYTIRFLPYTIPLGYIKTLACNIIRLSYPSPSSFNTPVIKFLGFYTIPLLSGVYFLSCLLTFTSHSSNGLNGSRFRLTSSQLQGLSLHPH